MEVIFYQKEDGSFPVEDFLKTLNSKERAKVVRMMTVLGEKGTALREPHSKPLGNGIMELRVQFAGNISRVLYFFTFQNKAVLTNGFVKKTQKTPPREIVLAEKYRSDYLRRNAR